jgi:hypothetical protein
MKLKKQKLKKREEKIRIKFDRKKLKEDEIHYLPPNIIVVVT